MRLLSILSFVGVALVLGGCKYPDNVVLHPHVEKDIGGTIEWHPHVKGHYASFEQWAKGSSDCGCPASAESEQAQ